MAKVDLGNVVLSVTKSDIETAVKEAINSGFKNVEFITDSENRLCVLVPVPFVE